ncbi:MAG: hypothetical protein LIO86_01970 [Lachnospiraceae bacterium]|nr:hypothetical protein [Lachnospiraceae bacterium]
MNKPVISAADAQLLNREVQKFISPQLFLCCNYEPTLFHGEHEDAKFMTAIQDLYKFAVDTSYVISHYWRYLQKEDKYQFRSLGWRLEEIKMLRAIFDHNQSEANGFQDRLQMQNFREWVNRQIQKEKPETDADYEKLNQRLTQISADLRKTLSQYIRFVGNCSNRDNFIEQWKSDTIKWYCRNTSTDYYMSQLKDRYSAECHRGGFYNVLSQRSLSIKVEKWMEAALCYPIDQKLEQIQQEMKEIEAFLNGSDGKLDVLLRQLGKEKFDILKSDLQEQVKALENKRIQAEREREELERRIDQNPRQYFFSILEDQLQDTVKKLDEKHVNYTYLPQDLLQEDIERVFRGVPSPEKDF